MGGEEYITEQLEFNNIVLFLNNQSFKERVKENLSS